MAIDLTEKCVLQYLCQDNDSSPVVRNAVEDDFVFVNDDGDFANNSIWTKESGWEVSGGEAINPGYPGANRIYQSKTIIPGKKYQTLFELVSRSAGTVAFYLGGTAGTYRETPGYYRQEITAGSSDNFLGLKKDYTGNISCDNFFVWDKAIYPFAGILNSTSPKTNSKSSTPGKVQARCFDLASDDFIFFNINIINLFVTDIVFWINPNNLASRQGLIKFGSGLGVAIDTDAKVKFFIDGEIYPFYEDYHFFIRVNNGSSNLLSSGWNFVWVSLGTMGQQLIDSQISYLEGNFYAGKVELFETFKPLEGSENLTNEEVAFLWNGGNGIIELKSTESNYYKVYRGQDGNIDYENPIANMGINDTQIVIDDQDLPPETIWHYIRRQVSPCEIESPDSPPCIVAIDSNGDMIGNTPNAPMNLSIEALAKAQFKLRWRYTPIGEEIPPTEFNIYMDSGDGFDFDNPTDSIPYGLGGNGEFNWTSDELTNGQHYKFCVRSYRNAAGESQNTNYVSAIADSAGPAAVTNLQADWEEI